MAEQKKVCVEVKDLKQHFEVKRGMFSNINKTVKAVDDVSFKIYKGETFGIVGESGCGKTTLGKTLLHLIPPTSGRVMIDGVEISSLKKEELRKARKDMQIVFQDPYSSLNSRLTVGTMIMEPMLAHGICSKEEANRRAV